MRTWAIAIVVVVVFFLPNVIRQDKGYAFSLWLSTGRARPISGSPIAANRTSRPLSRITGGTNGLLGKKNITTRFQLIQVRRWLRQRRMRRWTSRKLS